MNRCGGNSMKDRVINDSQSFLESLLVYSFRYTLGRQTCAVDDVAVAIIDNLDVLQPHTKKLIRKEIIEAVENSRAGARDHVERWRDVYEALGGFTRNTITGTKELADE